MSRSVLEQSRARTLTTTCEKAYGQLNLLALELQEKEYTSMHGHFTRSKTDTFGVKNNNQWTLNKIFDGDFKVLLFSLFRATSYFSGATTSSYFEESVLTHT